jgi:hypothetical protein
LRAFEYAPAASVAEALAELGRGARPLAGGTDLITLMQADLFAPARLVDVKRALARGLSESPAGGITVGALTPLSELDPHRRRFSVHPLQTFTHARGPEQLDGAYAAVTAEAEEARNVAVELAETLGLRPFELADDERALYHAGAAIASNFLVTLRRVAGRLVEDAGAPPEALDPLMRRTIENGFELTGPIARGDWATVEAHVQAIRARRPEYERLYHALAEVTQ